MPKPKELIRLSYEAYAQEYLRSLPLEHFMEARNQATQRKVFVASMELVTAERPDVWVFNEMLIQFKRPRRRRPGQVVPDNFVSISDEPIQAQTSYNVPLEPVGPFWTLEYVSQSNKRKDYEDNFDKYERELKVPYYLLFYHDIQDLTLYRHDGTKYVSVKPNETGRYAIPELEMEMALLDGWARFWFRGRLLPLPADLLRDLEATKCLLAEKEQALQAAEAEIARLRAQLARQDRPGGS